MWARGSAGRSRHARSRSPSLVWIVSGSKGRPNACGVSVSPAKGKEGHARLEPADEQQQAQQDGGGRGQRENHRAHGI